MSVHIGDTFGRGSGTAAQQQALSYEGDASALDCLNLLESELVSQHPPLRRLVLAVLELLQSDVARMEYFEFELDNHQQRQQAQSQQQNQFSQSKSEGDRCCDDEGSNDEGVQGSSVAAVAAQVSQAPQAPPATLPLRPHTMTIIIPPYPVIHRGTWARLERALLDIRYLTLNSTRYYISDRRLYGHLDRCLVAWNVLEAKKELLFQAIFQSTPPSTHHTTAAPTVEHIHLDSIADSSKINNQQKSERGTNIDFAFLCGDISKSHIDFVDTCFALVEVVSRTKGGGRSGVITNISVVDAIDLRLPETVVPVIHILGVALLTPILFFTLASRLRSVLTSNIQGASLPRLIAITVVGASAQMLKYISDGMQHRSRLSRVTNVLTDVQPILFAVPEEGVSPPPPLDISSNSVTDVLTLLGTVSPQSTFNNTTQHQKCSTPPIQLADWQREISWRFPGRPVPCPPCVPVDRSFLYFPRSDTDDGSILAMALSHQCPTALHQRRLLANVGQAQSSQHFGPFAPITAFFPYYVLQGCMGGGGDGILLRRKSDASANAVAIMAAAAARGASRSSHHHHPKSSLIVLSSATPRGDDAITSVPFPSDHRPTNTESSNSLLKRNSSVSERHQSTTLVSTTTGTDFRNRSYSQSVLLSTTAEERAVLRKYAPTTGNKESVSATTLFPSNSGVVDPPVPSLRGEEGVEDEMASKEDAVEKGGGVGRSGDRNRGLSHTSVGSWVADEVSSCLQRLSETEDPLNIANKVLPPHSITSSHPSSSTTNRVKATSVDACQQTDPTPLPSALRRSTSDAFADYDGVYEIKDDVMVMERGEEDGEADVELGVNVSALLPHFEGLAVSSQRASQSQQQQLRSSSSRDTTLSSFEILPELEIESSNITVMFVKNGKVLDEVNGASRRESSSSNSGGGGGTATGSSNITSPLCKSIHLRVSAVERLGSLVGSSDLARRPSVLFVVAHAPEVISDTLRQVSQQQVASVPMESLIVIVSNRISQVLELLPIVLDGRSGNSNSGSSSIACRRPFVVVDTACIVNIQWPTNPQVVALTTLLAESHADKCTTLLFSSNMNRSGEEVDQQLPLPVEQLSPLRVEYPLRREVLRALVAAGGGGDPSSLSSSSRPLHPPRHHHSPHHDGNPTIIATSAAVASHLGISHIGKPPLAALRHSTIRYSPKDEEWGRHALLSSSWNGGVQRVQSEDSSSRGDGGGGGTTLRLAPPMYDVSSAASAGSGGGGGSRATIAGDAGGDQHQGLLSGSLMVPGLFSGGSSINTSGTQQPHHPKSGSFRRHAGSSVMSDGFPDGVTCKISRCIGHGTFGVVFLGRLRQMPDTNVAIKQFYLKHGEEETFLIDMAYEAALLRCLEHPNIVRYFNSFVSDNCVNIVMQYCNGGNLNLRIGSSILRSEEYLMIMRDILEGVVYLHDHSIMHRDLKPENVLFHDGTLMLADFGTATKSIETVDGLHEIKGTFAYMAPEVLLGKQYGLACDIWSFACICADLIGVALPHRNMDLQAIRSMYSEEEEEGGVEGGGGAAGKRVFNYDPNRRLPKEMRTFFDMCFEMDWTKRASATALQECALLNDPSVITKYQKQLHTGQLALMSLTASSIAEAKKLKKSMRSHSARRSGDSSLGDIHSAVDGVVLYSVANRSQVVERYLRSGHVSREATPLLRNNSRASQDVWRSHPTTGGDNYPSTPTSTIIRTPMVPPSKGFNRSVRSEDDNSSLHSGIPGVIFSRSINSSASHQHPSSPHFTHHRPPIRGHSIGRESSVKLVVDGDDEHESTVPAAPPIAALSSLSAKEVVVDVTGDGVLPPLLGGEEERGTGGGGDYNNGINNHNNNNDGKGTLSTTTTTGMDNIITPGPPEVDDEDDEDGLWFPASQIVKK